MSRKEVHRVPSCLALLLLVSACGSRVPNVPTQNDPAYAVQNVRNWYLVGNALTAGHDTLEVRVSPPSGVRAISAWLDGQEFPLSESGADFVALIDISGLAPAAYQLLVAESDADTAFFAQIINRSHPLYVLMGNDWDSADNSDASLALQEQLRAGHPELKMTHFVGPYTFTDPGVTVQRRAELATWVLAQRDMYGDEIGLHIHPYCNFVNTTAVPCRTMPSTVYAQGDTTGYTIMVAAYTETEFTTLLEAADDLFVQNGLGKPTSFRAGGWTTGIDTLKALANAGYVVDTSALNWARMEEWQGVQNGVLYDWNMMQWASINETSQPYYPSQTDILQPGDLTVLEVPDNGILVDYVSGEEMIEMFGANFDGAPLASPTAYTIGYHPPNFSAFYLARLDLALNHIENFLISADAGPVVYANVSDMAQVWPR